MNAFNSLSALPGYLLYNQRCRSVLADVTDASRFRYLPEAYNGHADFGYGSRIARNVKYDSVYVQGQAVGEVCLQRQERGSYTYPSHVEVANIKQSV